MLDGVSGFAAAPGPVVDETGSFTVTARVRLDAAQLARKPVGYVAHVVGQQLGGETSWGIWYRQDTVDGGTPQGRWYFGRSAVDGSATVKDSATVSSVDFADLDKEPVVQLTGVYDAVDDTLRLYINEAEQAVDEDQAFPHPQQGVGELSIGRGRSGGRWGHHLPGEIGEVRLWTGAMNRQGIADKVLNICRSECDAA